MKVTIIVDGAEREWEDDYDTLHNRDYNEIARELLDEASKLYK
jgi:hypothetical protein